MYPQLLIDISITTDIVIVINNNGVVNVMPGGANINCSVGICGTANLLYTDTYNFY